MFKAIFDKIKTLFLGKWLKTLLDKVPANGKKTYFGLILLFVSVAFEVLACASTGGTACLVLGSIKAALLGVGGFDQITDPVVLSAITGLFTIFVGLWHKLLKALHKDEIDSTTATK